MEVMIRREGVTERRRSQGLTEDDRLSQLNGLAEPAHGDMYQSPLQLFGGVEIVHEQRGA